MLDYEVERGLNSPFGGSNICIFFKSEEDFFESVMENAIDAMYYNHFSHIDDDSGEWANEYLDMVYYIRNKYKDKIMKHYDDNCGSGSIPLKESKTSKEDYSDIETVINKIIPKSFSWFKKIEIDNISYSEFSNTLTIYGELKVDEEWGAKQWREYYEYTPFPSNSGWEEEDPVRLGDIIGKGELDDLNDELELIVSSVGGYSIIDTMRLGQLKLYFV